MSHLQFTQQHKPALHRCSDSLENFILKFQIRELKNLIFDTDMINNNDKGASKDDHLGREPYGSLLNIKWQDKIYGPEEIHNYIKYKTEKCPDHFREKKKIMQTYETKHNIKFEDLLKPTMVYTFTDNDSYRPDIPSQIVCGDGTLATHVSYHGSHNGNLENSSIISQNNANKVITRQNNENGMKQMLVCLASNVDVEKLKTNVLDPRMFYDEYVLCTIEILDTSASNEATGLDSESTSKDLLVIMTPNMSPLLPEQSATQSLLSATLDDASSYAAIKQGLRLENYRLSCRGGSEFLYTIENLNQKISPLEISSLEQKDRIMEKMSVLSNRGLQYYIDGGSKSAAVASIGNADDQNELRDLWKQDPPKPGFDKNIIYMGEIVSADGFGEEEALFIEYFFAHSDSYSLRTGNRSDGAENPLTDASTFDAESIGLMRGQTMISYSSSNNSSRHGLTLPRLRPGWDGFVFTSELPQVSRVIIGYSLYVLVFLILLFDFDRPMWIFVAVVLLFFGMTASPNTALQMVVSDDKVNNQASGGSYGQSAARSLERSNVKVVGDTMTETSFNINHPIHGSFDVKEVATNNNFDSDKGPIIYFQVFGHGALGTQTLIGYGYTQLPSASGFIDVSVSTWKPIGDTYSRMSELYLGTSTRVRHHNFIHHSQNSRIINKFGVATETSGRIRFRCQTITVTPASSIVYTQPRPAQRVATGLSGMSANSQSSSTSSLHRSGSKGSLKNLRVSKDVDSAVSKARDVNDILQEMGMSGKGGSGHVVTSASSDKIAEIMANAKAKRGHK